MPNVDFLQVCLVLLLVIGSGTNGAGKPITCHAGTYASGSPATITCNFNTDLSVANLGVNVVRLPKDATQSTMGTDILVCNWEGKTMCDVVQSGYKFNYTNQGPFKIMIPTVSEEFAGLYKCFLVPPGDTDPQACELTLKEITGVSCTSPEPPTSLKTGENKHVWTIVVIVIVAVTSWIVIGIFVFRRLRSNRHEQAVRWHGRLGSEERVSLICTPGEQLQQTLPCNNQEIETLVSRFRLFADDLKGIMQVITKEIKACINNKGGARMKQYSTHLPSMPNGRENGDYLVVALGSTTLKILLIKLGEGNFKIHPRYYKIESEIRLGPGKQLFQFLADSVHTFLREHNLTEQTLPLAFVFSFPCQYYQGKDLTKARLVKWVKEFDCNDVVGKDVGGLLQEALNNNMQTKKLAVTAVINDGVGILVSLAHKDPKCVIGLVFGNGFNACYIQEDTNDVAEGGGEKHAYTVINNTEFGAMADSGCLEPYRTAFDRDLDSFSVNRKEQILEKMVSRAYIGEIARLVLVKLIDSGLLFTSNKAECEALRKKGGFGPHYVALIETDKDKGHFNTKFVLKQLGMDNYTDDDCKTVSYVCGLISERSAHLAAAAVAALINHLNKPEITIAVDGSMYRSHPRFQEHLTSKTRELINKGLKFTIKPSLNGSGIGAALIAAVSSSQKMKKNRQ